MNSTKKSYVCFIRHGQTDWNVKGLMQGREDIPLNEQGISQAQEAARALKLSASEGCVRFDKIISSPLLRAYKMAEIIKDELNIPLLIADERATERDFGELSGKPYNKTSDAIIRDCPDFPTLETVDSLVNRVGSMLAEQIEDGQTALVVTHGAVSRIFADNAPLSDSFSGVFDPFLNNCHTVIYQLVNGRAYLVGYNIPPRHIHKYIKVQE